MMRQRQIALMTVATLMICAGIGTMIDAVETGHSASWRTGAAILAAGALLAYEAIA